MSAHECYALHREVTAAKGGRVLQSTRFHERDGRRAYRERAVSSNRAKRTPTSPSVTM